jgi:VWFA-related protein
MHMKERAAKLLDTLQPEDRVAVVSFDTHLKLWTDFTTDRRKLLQIVERSILFEDPPAAVEGSYPSLAQAYDRGAATKAASPEAGFIVLANALAPLPGTKSVAFFGWGLGRMSGDGVDMLPEYDIARRALRDARVIVFSLDITEADQHSLEIGLEQLAEDTGGFYVKTHLFPALAMDRLERALAGYYALAFEKPLLPRGQHLVKVALVARKGNVLTTATYVD